MVVVVVGGQVGKRWVHYPYDFSQVDAGDGKSTERPQEGRCGFVSPPGSGRSDEGD